MTIAAQRRPYKAKAMFSDVLEKLSEVQGADVQFRCQVLSGLALVYAFKSKWAETEKYLSLTYSDAEKHFGRTHFYTVEWLSALMNFYCGDLEINVTEPPLPPIQLDKAKDTLDRFLAIYSQLDLVSQI
jgi:hypothetical protein